MKSFKVTTMFGTEICTMSASKYADNGNLALQLWCEDGPFATLTVNLRETRKYPGNFAFIDTNNCPWAEALIRRLKLGVHTGKYAHSGFCSYPLYELDIARLSEITGQSVEYLTK